MCDRSSLTLLALLAVVTGCGRPPAAAPAQLHAHVEGVAMVSPDENSKSGFTGSLDVAAASAGCCDLGAFVAATSQEDPQTARIGQVLHGGAQVGVVLPFLQDRLRVRARIGKAGTPPKSPLFGRSGISTSTALAFRLFDPSPPLVDEMKPNVDLLLGLSTLSLNSERSSAGSLKEPGPGVTDFGSVDVTSFIIGIRIGAEYGLDLD